MDGFLLSSAALACKDETEEDGLISPIRIFKQSNCTGDHCLKETHTHEYRGF